MSIEELKEKMIDDAQRRKAVRNNGEKKARESKEAYREVKRLNEIRQLREEIAELKRKAVLLGLAVIFWTFIGAVTGFVLGVNQVNRFFGPLNTNADKFLAITLYFCAALYFGGPAFMFSNITRKDNLRVIKEKQEKIRKLRMESKEYYNKFQ